MAELPVYPVGLAGNSVVAMAWFGGTIAICIVNSACRKEMVGVVWGSLAHLLSSSHLGQIGAGLGPVHWPRSKAGPRQIGSRTHCNQIWQISIITVRGSKPHALRIPELL